MTHNKDIKFHIPKPGTCRVARWVTPRQRTPPCCVLSVNIIHQIFVFSRPILTASDKPAKWRHGVQLLGRALWSAVHHSLRHLQTYAIVQNEAMVNTLTQTARI